jgi:nucleoside diphosphate kinase
MDQTYQLTVYDPSNTSYMTSGITYTTNLNGQATISVAPTLVSTLGVNSAELTYTITNKLDTSDTKSVVS